MVMLFSTRRLMKEHRETRIYVTQIFYSREGQPISFYIFMPEGNTELEVYVYSVIAQKKLSSRKETLYHVRTSNDHSLLLIVDHLRGNHYSFCKLETITHIIEMKKKRNLPLESTEAAIHRIEEGVVAHSSAEIREKVVIIDTEILCKHLEIVDDLITSNKIVLNPYYAMEINSYTVSEDQRNIIFNRVDYYIQQHPDRIIKNTYLQRLKIDVSDPHEYLATIATQQQIPRSNIFVVTMKSSFSALAKLQGFSIYLVKSPSEFSETALKLVENKRVEPRTKTNFVSFDSGGLPPRSKRHRGTTSFTAKAMRSFFSFISF
jgi:hypothetical protein